MRRVWHENMSNGKPCEAHHIPEDICARCKGVAEERERLLSDPELYRKLRERWLVSKMWKSE